MQQFNTVLRGKFPQLIDLTDTDVDVVKLTSSFNTTRSDTTEEVLGKCQSKKKPWMTDDILALCDRRRKLKKQMKESDPTSEFCKCNNRKSSRDIG